MSEFLTFLRQGIDRGGFETEDILSAVIPLMREVLTIHESGAVAPLRGTSSLSVHEGRSLGLSGHVGVPIERQDKRLQELSVTASHGLEVIGEMSVETDVDTFAQSHTNLAIAHADQEITRPVYLPGYCTWEHAIGHHDPLTDVLSLGLIIASIACSLDFTDAEDVALFANSRKNLFALARRLHPVIASVICEMTELQRNKRAQDLPSLIRKLETYRDQPVDIDLSSLPGLQAGTKKDKRAIIQTHLRDRLFEVSRRNKLLYFKHTQSTINLTIASVPLVLDYRNIKPEELFYWHESLARDISVGHTLALNRWLRLDDAPYLPGQLDKLISETRRDRAEYGFSQLRMVLAFLRWHNLKEAPEERIHSPLLLLPVELTKQKGVKDHYMLEASDSMAEVNPALRQHLKHLYNLDLPETIDLRVTSLASFHETLQSQIHASEPGVTLSLAEKPRIQLFHEKAKQRVDQYRRRIARSAKKVHAAQVDYSYDKSDFRPLGLQVFQQKISPSALPMRDLAGAPPAPRPLQLVSEHKSFSLVEDSLGNPFTWEVDLCSLTLANFNYRKMTLVRDYSQLIAGDLPNAAFDRVFSLDPKKVDTLPIPHFPPSQQYLIIAADATQTGAIARARTGESFIIQGPPGTGKSQTITSLIADYVALGKRVLFVCEKRAAIDVVFHRLRQQGLDELCCLIHDSQTDKKEFILNLKQTYEQWLATKPNDVSESKRNSALASLESELSALETFTLSSQAANPLLLRLIELRNHTHDWQAPLDEDLPDYPEWQGGGDSVIRLANALHDLGVSPIFSRHPLRWLRDLEISVMHLEEIEQKLSELDDTLQQTGLALEHWDTMSEVAQLLEASRTLLPLARKNLLALLDQQSAVSENFATLCRAYAKKQKALEQTQKKTLNWRTKLPADETATALAQSQKIEGLLGFLHPAWWRMRKVLRNSYDFSKHAVKPSWSQILSELSAEHAAFAEVEEIKDRCEQEYSSHEPEQLREQLLALSQNDSPAAAALRQAILSSQEGPELVERLASLAPSYTQLCNDLEHAFFEPQTHSLASLAAAAREMLEEMDALPELIPSLRDLAQAPLKLSRAVRTRDLSVEQLESACAAKSLAALYRDDRSLQRFDGHVLKQKLDRMAQAHHQWLDQNASWILNESRKRFLEHVKVANQSASVLSNEQKIFKKIFSSGRRELEHEFGKSMRFKSIRDLAAGDSGEVVRDLKPIWLMSPLSVSDTLPLDASSFDVVIFDEASQIPVEEAVPAAYRAQQVIVVGDEMQLPPTSFFSTSSEVDDEIMLEEDGEKISVLLDADSFLAQSARNLSSTLLAWHYRSRYEALISFSNAAFYGGELFTIPDRQIAHRDQSEMRISTPEEAIALVPALLSRPISMIHCESMPYENRSNVGEAASIAQIVRKLLTDGSPLSIGIAAFSEAQQSEIERALSALAESDPAFAILLECAYNREEDDQFCGLFVKNLENIQGDERDIILMSVCYGRDPNGRILMNFGPINQRGGEKRLNVIFSRARHHMVLLTSMRHSDITNDYNDGAHALKNFLHYADCLTRGDVVSARQILEGLNPLKRSAQRVESTSAIAAEQIVSALRERGWDADMQIGQSRFRCDVAARAKGNPLHQVGILLDVVGDTGVLERFHTQPSILQAFGWQVLVVLMKDWWHSPEAVIERIERLLRNESDASDPTTLIEPETETVPETLIIEEVSEIIHPAATVESKRFELIEGASKKFWQICHSGCDMTVSYGRIGTLGQSQTKTFPDEQRATREVQKLIAEKIKKGYREIAP